MPHLRRFINFVAEFHGLTTVAIEWRSFGPRARWLVWAIDAYSNVTEVSTLVPKQELRNRLRQQASQTSPGLPAR